MSRKRIHGLAVPILLALVALMTAACRDCPPANTAGGGAPAGTDSVGDDECNWEASGTAGSTERDLVCRIGGRTVRVDTAGIGEG